VPNRLASESSPYLLQHKNNPVDWYPWGAEALERAKAEDKPLLVSIGYSACHWCHVMAHESFEDPDIAALLNEHLVCLKVDREERPDIDSVCMTAVQAMTGQGGWPLNAFLTPDGVPFFGGTYWPPQDRQGMPSFRRVVEAVVQTWTERRSEILAQGEQIRAALAQRPPATSNASDLDEDTVIRAVARIANNFDTQNGGFGGAPKFPQAPVLEFLLRAHHLLGDRQPLEMAVATLEQMAEGGMFDQIGGGFHRYSVDAIWLVPHFEKMLYDNAQLARVYLDAWRLTGSDHMREIAERVLDYLLREMAAPGGAFYAAQDADSEGVEGKFYVWAPEQVRAVLTGEAADLALSAYGITESGNFEGESIPTAPPLEMAEALRPIREQLYEARSRRVWPGLDDKILTSWNAMAIRAFAEAGAALDREDYRDAAVAGATFIKEQLDREGVLYRSFGSGQARIAGFLEDYANLIDALMAVYEATFDLTWLDWAVELAGRMIERFSEGDGPGFYDTSANEPGLIVRPRDFQDGATPCGNSVAFHVLIRLGHITGREAWVERGTAGVTAMRDLMESQPLGFGRYLSAAALALGVVREIAIAGEVHSDSVDALASRLLRRFEPGAIVGLVSDESIKRMPWLADRPMRNGQATAYLCEQFVCLPPVTSPDDLTALLETGTGMVWTSF